MNKNRILKLVNTPIRDDPRAMNEGTSLVHLGYDVTIIGVARDKEDKRLTYDTVQGMKTVLVPMITTSSPFQLVQATWQLLRGKLGTYTEVPTSRMSNLISFLFFNLWLLQVGRRLKFEVVHCHDALPLPAAWLLARLKKAKLVYDARESVPDLYTGLKGRLMARIEQFVLTRADVVITVGERLASSLEQRGARKVVIIGNWKRLEEYDIPESRITAERNRLGLNDTDCIISYLGGLDPTRDIMPLLQAVAQSPNVTLLIGGRGMIEEEVKVFAEKTPNIRWLGWIPMSDVPLYTHLSTAVYYCLNFDQNSQQSLSVGNNYYSTPNKLFEAFAAGKVIIARKGVGEIGAIIEKIPAGILLDHVTPETLMEAFKQLSDEQQLLAMKKATMEGRKLYNWDVAEARIALIYENLGKL